MKKVFSLLLLLGLSLTMSACGEEEDVVALMISNRSNEFFSVLENAFIDKAEDLGYTVEVYDAANDATLQPSQVEDAIAKGVKAIVINPLNKDATKSVLNDAVDKGIPVITIDTSVVGVELLAEVATDNVDGGQFAAEWLVGTSGILPTELAGLIHMKGIDGHTAHIARYAGFNDYLTSSSVSADWNALANDSDMYIELTGNFAQDVAQTAFESKLSALDVNGKYVVYCENDVMAIGVIGAIENDSRFDLANFTLIGFDGSQDGKDLVDAGKMAVTVVQDFEFIGSHAAVIADNFLSSRAEPANTVVAIEVVMYPTNANPRD